MSLQRTMHRKWASKLENWFEHATDWFFKMTICSKILSGWRFLFLTFRWKDSMSNVCIEFHWDVRNSFTYPIILTKLLWLLHFIYIYIYIDQFDIIFISLAHLWSHKWCIEAARANWTSWLLSCLCFCIIVTRWGKALDCIRVTSQISLSESARVFGDELRFVMYFNTAGRLYYKYVPKTINIHSLCSFLIG